MQIYTALLSPRDCPLTASPSARDAKVSAAQSHCPDRTQCTDSAQIVHNPVGRRFREQVLGTFQPMLTHSCIHPPPPQPLAL